MSRLPSLRRLAHVARVAGRHGLGALAARAGWRRPASARLDGPERLRVMLEELGGSFVKLGQMLALQPDILPLAYCDALFDLLDRIEPFPWEEAERVFVAELGRRPEEVFERFDRAPVATASVGQVYVARLDGEKVAVKIQRPRAEDELGSDVRLIVVLMGLIRRLRLRRLEWLLEPLGEFVAWTEEELDFRFEARYAERLRRRAEAGPIPEARIQKVPKVWSALTTRRTLVAEWIEGPSLLELLRAGERGDETLARRLAAEGFDRQRFAAHVIDNFLHDAFQRGVYHADLHPANLLVLPGNVVGYVDFGITGVMSRFGRRRLVEMTLALAGGDLAALMRSYVRITVHGAGADPEGFRRELAERSQAWYDDRDGRRRLATNFTRIMSDMLEMSRRHQMLPERDIVKYIRSSIAVDGLITRFAPGFDVGGHLVAACSRFLRRRARQEALRLERLLEWSATASRLARDGPRRAAQALDGLAELQQRRPERRRAGGGARAVELGVAALALVALAPVTAGAGGLAATWGWNVWTAQVATAGAALVALLFHLHARPRRRQARHRPLMP